MYQAFLVRVEQTPGIFLFCFRAGVLIPACWVCEACSCFALDHRALVDRRFGSYQAYDQPLNMAKTCLSNNQRSGGLCRPCFL